jgi:hypothetical protein
MTNHARVAHYFPEAYKGRVHFAAQELTIIEIATLTEMPPIFRRYGHWVVTPEGILCLTNGYYVRLDRIAENDWVEHMQHKVWVNRGDFESALFAARDMVELGILKVVKQAGARVRRG